MPLTITMKTTAPARFTTWGHVTAADGSWGYLTAGGMPPLLPPGPNSRPVGQAHKGLQPPGPPGRGRREDAWIPATRVCHTFFSYGCPAVASSSGATAATGGGSCCGVQQPPNFAPAPRAAAAGLTVLSSVELTTVAGGGVWQHHGRRCLGHPEHTGGHRRRRRGREGGGAPTNPDTRTRDALVNGYRGDGADAVGRAGGAVGRLRRPVNGGKVDGAQRAEAPVKGGGGGGRWWEAVKDVRHACRDGARGGGQRAALEGARRRSCRGGGRPPGGPRPVDIKIPQSVLLET